MAASLGRRVMKGALLAGAVLVVACEADDGDGFGDDTNDGGTGPGGSGGASPCGPCNGCCNGSSCIPAEITDWKACGANGSACVQCGEGALCTSAGQCAEEYWGPDVTLRLRMGVVEVSMDCDTFDGCDPYVCFSFRGQTHCSATCDDTSVCDYGSSTNPFVVEGMTPADFVDGQLQISVMDEDVASNDTIWSGNVTWNAPFPRSASGYPLTPDGTLVRFDFTLEAM